MPSNISRKEMEAYRQAALARQAREQKGLLQRRKAALEVAQQAAKLLKEEFGATRVVMFGSLAHNAWFSQRSDIYLAAEGIPPATLYLLALRPAHSPLVVTPLTSPAAISCYHIEDTCWSGEIG